MKTKLIAYLLIALLALTASGCATPLGQHYSTVGAFGGGGIGGALGGWEGAAAGAFAGALGGALLGDQQAYELERQQRHDYYDYHRHQHYVRPCQRVRVPVYDRYGYEVGYRIVCN